MKRSSLTAENKNPVTTIPAAIAATMAATKTGVRMSLSTPFARENLFSSNPMKITASTNAPALTTVEPRSYTRRSGAKPGHHDDVAK